MDPYEVHKKIQEALLALEIYRMTATRSSQWDKEIRKGLDQLVNIRKALRVLEDDLHTTKTA